MRVFLVEKSTGEIMKVALMHHKNNINTYSFVNLSHNHICPCVFNSVDEAIQDLDKYIENGHIKSYREFKNICI